MSLEALKLLPQTTLQKSEDKCSERSLPQKRALKGRSTQSEADKLRQPTD